MPPVWVIPQTVAVVKGRHPRWLVTPQACAIRGQVPLQRHGPYGQACAVGGAVPRAQGLAQAVVGSAPPSDGLGGAVGLRPLPGRGAGSPPATPLAHPLGPRPAQGPRGPRGHAPPALGARPFGRCLLGRPGRVKSWRAPWARTGLFPLQARVEQAQPPRELGPESPPRLPCCCPAVWAHRACLGGGRQRRRLRGTRALTPLPGHGSGRLDHAPPPTTAAPNGRRDVDLGRRSPGPRLIGPQGAGPLGRVWHRGAPPRRPAPGPPGPLPEPGLAATAVGQGLKRSPPLPQGEGFFDGLGACHPRRHAERRAKHADGPGWAQGDPGYAQVWLARPGGVVPGKARVPRLRKPCRVWTPPLVQLRPIRCRVVDRLPLQRCPRTRPTDRRMAPGWCSCPSSWARGRASQYGGISGTIPLVCRRSFHQPQNPVESGFSQRLRGGTVATLRAFL